MAFVLASVGINDEDLDEKAWVFDNFDLAKESYLSVISGYAREIIPLEEGVLFSNERAAGYGKRLLLW